MFRPRCLPILIGSLPVSTHQAAIDLILATTPEVPLWPQLPKKPREGMVRQFLSGFPGLVDEGNRFWVDSTGDAFSQEMTAFYEDYLQAVDAPSQPPPPRFSLGPDSAAGFELFCAAIRQRNPPFISLKGQVTGPITTGIGARDRHGNAILYDDNLRDMLIKHLSLKAVWQTRQLCQFTGAVSPIIFIDEPGLVSFGSSGFAGVSSEMVTSAVGEVIEAIQLAGGLAGVHICANGDWGPALASRADILSFDAYSYFPNLLLFRRELTEYLHRGGMLAWGIVPTGDPDLVARASVDSLYGLWLQQLEKLATFGFSEQQLMEQTFIAPACGTGSLSEELAIKVLNLTSTLAKKCRKLLPVDPKAR